MFFKVLAFLTTLCLLAKCEPPVAAPFPQYGVPFSHGGGSNYNNAGGYNNANAVAPSNTYGAPSNYNNNNNNGYNTNNNGYNNNNNNNGGYGGDDHHGHHDEGYGEPKAYEFGYQVKDDYTGTNYNRQEQSDGNQVTGSYRVALPDGRTQIVTYYADWKTGFHADVRYEGEAQYPQTYKTYNQNQNQGYNNQNAGYNYNQGGYSNNNNYNNALSNQYGPPVNPLAINNNMYALSQNYAAPISSTVAPHHYNDNNNYYSNNYNNNNNYDSSYANQGTGFGNKVQPAAVYGAP